MQNMLDISIPTFVMAGGKSDDPLTLSDRKEDQEGGKLDATTKRHYNHPVVYEWDEQKILANLIPG